MPIQYAVRKHRAPNGALRPDLVGDAVVIPVEALESTEHQTVH